MPRNLAGNVVPVLAAEKDFWREEEKKQSLLPEKGTEEGFTATGRIFQT